jgi:hypothetical protein
VARSQRQASCHRSLLQGRVHVVPILALRAALVNPRVRHAATAPWIGGVPSQRTRPPSVEWQHVSRVWRGSRSQAERLFAALADGGQVQMPLAKTFFSSRFGMVADRFGVSWMVYVAP